MVKSATWLFVFTFVVLIIFLPAYTKWQDLRNKNLEYSQQIEGLKKENANLAQEKERLLHDPIYLEKVAREKMGLVREGEVVYRMTPSVQNKTVSRKNRKAGDR